MLRSLEHHCRLVRCVTLPDDDYDDDHDDDDLDILCNRECHKQFKLVDDDHHEDAFCF